MDVNLAYKVLGNERLKKQYDTFGVHGIGIERRKTYTEILQGTWSTSSQQDSDSGCGGNEASENLSIDDDSEGLQKQIMETIVEEKSRDITSGEPAHTASIDDFHVRETTEINQSSEKLDNRYEQSTVQPNNYPDMRGQVEVIGRPRRDHGRKYEGRTKQPTPKADYQNDKVVIEDVVVEQSFFQGSGGRTENRYGRMPVCKACGGTGVRVQISRTRQGEVRMQRPCKECSLVTDASDVMINSVGFNQRMNKGNWQARSTDGNHSSAKTSGFY